MGEMNEGGAALSIILLFLLTICLVTVVRRKKDAKLIKSRKISVAKLAGPAFVFVIIGSLYFGIFNPVPQGTECERSLSANGIYIAERCFLKAQSFRSGDAKYVGRLFDAKSGSLLAEHTFTTPVPDLFWSTGFYTDYPKPKYIGPSVNFSRGGKEGDGSDISLPPSIWERLLAMRPRLN